MRTFWKILIPLVILALGYWGMTALSDLKSDNPHRRREVQPKSVEAIIVYPGPVKANVSGYGRVASLTPIDLVSEVSGPLEAGDIGFQPGQSFSKGDLLAKVDDRQITLDINSRKADLLTALASVLPEIKADFPDSYNPWQEYFDRCQFDQPLLALPETTDRKIKLYLSRFNVYKLYFGIRNLEIIAEKHYFYAPFDGSIVTANLRVGSTVRPGSLLGRIISFERQEVEISLAVADIRWLDSYTPVEFTLADNSGRWFGRTTRIGAVIDDKTQTVSVFVQLENPESPILIDGVFLQAKLGGQTIDPAVRVPRRAIYEDRYVYKVVDGLLQHRQIRIARSELNDVIVDSGLLAGDTLVTEVLQGVAPGMPAVPRLTPTESGSL